MYPLQEDSLKVRMKCWYTQWSLFEQRQYRKTRAVE